GAADGHQRRCRSLVAAPAWRRQRLGGRAGFADGDHRARRPALADHRLRRRGPDRLRAAVRWPSGGAVRHPRPSGPRGRLRAPVRLRLLQPGAPRPHPPVRAGAGGAAAAPARRRLSQRAGRGWRQLLGRVPAGAGGRGLLARRPAPGGVPGPPPLAGHRVRPAPAGQPGVERRHPPDPRDPGPLRRRRRAHRPRLWPGRQSLAYRHRRPRARVSGRAAPAHGPVPLRQRRRRRCPGRPRLRRRPPRPGAGPGPADRAGGAALMSAVQASAALPRDRLGRPLRDLRLSVIDACNFRCGYCMPADRVPDDHGTSAASRMSFDQIETLVRGFVQVGVRKLRLTGGEPLLRRNLPELIARLARIPGIEDLALTTNGALLAAQARALREAGLRRLTVSLDALDPGVFRAMSGNRGEVATVLEGIAAAEAAGFGRLKINCVVLRGTNDHQVLPLLEHFRGTGHVVRFIEYMDVGTCNGWDPAQVVRADELRDRIAARWPLRPLAAGYTGEVAQRYAFADGGGEVGFINSVSAPFCGDCHRARVSADGQLYTCLF